MKFTLLIVLFSLFAFALAHPGVVADATIVSQKFNIDDSKYEFGFEGSDQTSQDVSGVLVDAGSETAHYAVHGSYKYVDPDGKNVEVTYTADENGFQPEGEIIHSAIVGAARVIASPFVAGAKAIKSVL